MSRAIVSPGTTLLKFLEDRKLTVTANRMVLRRIVRGWLVNLSLAYASFLELNPIKERVSNRAEFIQLANKNKISPLDQVGIRKDFTASTFHANEDSMIGFLNSFSDETARTLRECNEWHRAILPADVLSLADTTRDKCASDEMMTKQHSRNTSSSHFNVAEMPLRTRDWLDSCKYTDHHFFEVHHLVMTKFSFFPMRRC